VLTTTGGMADISGITTPARNGMRLVPEAGI
jgi:hypothetical protein